MMSSTLKSKGTMSLRLNRTVAILLTFCAYSPGQRFKLERSLPEEPICWIIFWQCICNRQAARGIEDRGKRGQSPTYICNIFLPRSQEYQYDEHMKAIILPHRSWPSRRYHPSCSGMATASLCLRDLRLLGRAFW